MEKMNFFKKQTKERMSVSYGNPSRTTRFHRAMMVALLALVALGAKAQTNYVFYNADYGYIYNNDGSVGVKSTFDESCVWTANNSLGSTSRNIYSYIDNTKYMRGASANITLGNSNNEWRGNGTYLQWRSGSSYFVKYNGTSFTNSSTQNNGNRFNYYQVTITNATTPTFSISYPTADAYVGNVGGTMSISANVSGNYKPKYYNFNNRYYLEDGTDYGATAPSQVSSYTYTYELVGECADYATISGNTVTYVTDAGHDVVAQVKVTAKPQGYDVIVGEKTCSFILRSATIAAPTITRIEGTNQYQIATTAQGASIQYTIDDTDINEWASNGTTYSGPITVTTNGAVIKAKAVREGKVSAQTEYTVSDVILLPPTITIDGDGKATIENPNTFATGATIYYTTNGATPTSSSTPYTSTVQLSNMGTIKAIVVADGYVTSAEASEQYSIPSGVSGGVVTLNDYEDHNWTYYAGVDASVDGGHYNTAYLGKLYSPNPRNVKITYNATNGAQVSISESQTSFVYYKTIEKVDNAYKYQVISNPFSKRPAHSGSTYYGFTGWKIVSGGQYIDGYDNDQTIPLDAEITFVNLNNKDGGEYTPNCTSAEIVFETTWGTANRTYITTNPGSAQTYTFNSGTYETNFIVINCNYSRQITISGSATIMMVEPDGSSDYRGKSFSNLIVPATGADNTTKIEWASWAPNSAIDGRGRNFYVGRGVNTTSQQNFDAQAQDAKTNQVLRVESGKYNRFYHYSKSLTSTNNTTKQWIVLGCDYDRAKNDNSKLTFATDMRLGYDINNIVSDNAAGANSFMSKVWIKSGEFMTGQGIADGELANSYYICSFNTGNTGKRYLEMEGGILYATIAGGRDKDMNGVKNSVDYINTMIRIKGGEVKGSIFGSAKNAAAQGSRQIIMTGGTVRGWIAGGCNGTNSTAGETYGTSYIYIGGNARVDSEGSNTSIGASIGGNVYGAGCGYSSTSTSGKMMYGTNVIMADNAYVERGVYGGGSLGYCETDQTAYVYVTGGHVEGKAGNYKDRAGNTANGVIGGVFGGARMRDGGEVKMYMTGGVIESGLFGGSNYTGTLAKSVTMQINGGQVGTTTKTANIHGGGYGQPTIVSGDVNITLGKTGSERDAEGVLVYGDVYGGSALGSVNGTAATTTYHTNVTMNAGYIHGSLYGGALGATGTAANVYGPVAVKVYGGSVKKTDENGANGSGAVYGCNNIYGAPQRAVTVDIYGTDEAQEEGEYALFAVYGGGNHANYTYGNGYPKVTIHNCDNSIEYVYGGGNQATVPGTQVKVYGGDVIGNVFGGGNNANVTTNGTDVDIYGGTILNVFGGNNNGGSVTGNISVTVDAQAETTGDDPCDMSLGNVYGGGNIASYTGNPVVDFLNGTSTGSVFGGGKGKEAVVVGNPTVNIGDWDDNHSAYIGGNVFGGGDLAAVEGNPAVTIRDCGTVICGDLYGGGNAAPVYSTNTTMWGGTVKGNVFGGGNGSDATKNPNGAQVGYQRNDTDTGGTGNAVTNIYGGTIGTWEEVDGVLTCTAGGGVFGGSNTNGNITGEVNLTLDGKDCVETGDNKTLFGDGGSCALMMKEIYGAGNLAAYTGAGGVTLSLGCITSMGEIYGGAKQADMTGDVDLKITSGHFDKVFGGNNVSGKLNGKIVVTIDETGCNPVTIGALYGGGNLAPYSVYGYNTDGTVKESGTKLYADPVVNIISCTSIGTVYGGGLGESAKVVGDPTVNINQIPGENADQIDADGDNTADGNANAVGTIGTVYGGGDAAPVEGSTTVNIGTATADQAHVTGADQTTTYPVSVNITGNVFGAGYGSTATVSGDTKVTVGPKKN